MKAFFKTPMQLAQLFTNPNWRNPEKDGKYLEGGFKPIEAFEGDIIQNLLMWATDGKKAYYYMTKKYWYVFELEEVEKAKIVTMSRFTLGAWERMDDWANLHSVATGKAWLSEPKQMKKKVKLFES